MGGVINVAIRFKDGRTICQERWTNNMPFWFKTPAMWQGDEAHVQAYIDMTKENDWIADPHAPGRPMPVRNSEYGLIVWDYLTGFCLDNNGYSDPSIIDAMHADPKSDKHDEFRALAEAGLLRARTRVWDRSSRALISDETTDWLSPEDAMAMGIEARRAENALFRDPDYDSKSLAARTMVTFEINTGSMTYIKYPDRAAAPMRKKLKELGFPLTKKEGLNASLPKIKKRKIKASPLEVLASELYQEFKKLPSNAALKGVAFDDTTPEFRKSVFELAQQISDDPKLLRQHNMNQILGSASNVIMITGGPDKEVAK